MKLKRVLTHILSIVLAQPVMAFTTDTLIVATRYRSADTMATGDTLTIQFQIQNSESSPLRGFFLSDQVPLGLSVLESSIRIDGVELGGHTCETGEAGDTYEGNTPYRWVLETPPDFSEEIPIPPGAVAEIECLLECQQVGVYVFRNFDWACAIPGEIDTAYAFGYDDDSLVVVVTQANRGPVLHPIGDRALPEGDTLSFTVTASDPDADPLVLSAGPLPPDASFTDNGDGSGDFFFTPDSTQLGIHYVTFIAHDGELADSEIVGITVTDVNFAPVLDSIGPKSVPEGDTLGFVVAAIDPDGDSLILSVDPLCANASFDDGGDGTGTFLFVPDFTQAGVHDVTFVAYDGELADSEVVSITVRNVNRPPVLDSIGAKVVVEGDTLTFVVTTSDPDLDDSVSLSVDTLPANASFTDNGDGTGYFFFTPDWSQVGVHVIRFDVSDGALADSEFVTVTVTELENRPPELDRIGPQVIAEGDTLSVTVTATDPDGDSLILSAGPLPRNASFVDDGDGTGDFLFIPDFTQAGVREVTFVAYDGELADSEVVSITVRNVNRPPALDSIGAKSVTEGDTLRFVVNASDPDGDSLTLSATPLPSNASFVDSGDGRGYFLFAPDSTQAGAYRITFTASDGASQDSEAVTIGVVSSGNHPPVLNSIGSQLTAEGDTLGVSVSATDPDGDPLLLSTGPLPRNGGFVDNGDGTGDFLFHPDYTQSGVHEVIFAVYDGEFADSEVVSITVENVNLPPALDSIGSKGVVEGDSLSFVVSASDPDPNDSVSLSVDTLPANASFTDNGDGTGDFLFTPDSSQVGVYGITFSASDGVLVDSEFVTVTVARLENRPPSLDPVGNKLRSEGDSLRFTVTATDPDGDSLLLSAGPLPLNASFVDNGNGTGNFLFAPDFTQSGEYDITFAASDGLLADSELVTITVMNVNRPPVLDSIGSKSVVQGDTLRFTITAEDPDGDTVTIAVDSLPANASLVDDGEGRGHFFFAPDWTQEGLHEVLFIARDGVLADSELVTITVGRVGVGEDSVSYRRVDSPLLSVCPNPFSDVAVIEYTLPTEGLVTIDVYNADGQLVRRLSDRKEPHGYHRVAWARGSLPCGVYLVQLSACETVRTKKVILIR